MRDAYCPHDDYTVHCNCWWDGHALLLLRRWALPARKAAEAHLPVRALPAVHAMQDGEDHAASAGVYAVGRARGLLLRLHLRSLLGQRDEGVPRHPSGSSKRPSDKRREAMTALADR